MCLSDLWLTALIRAPSTVGKCPGSRRQIMQKHSLIWLSEQYSQVSACLCSDWPCSRGCSKVIGSNLSVCISHPPVWNFDNLTSCLFFGFFFCSAAYTYEYGITTLSTFTTRTWCAKSERWRGQITDILLSVAMQRGHGHKGQHQHCCHCTKSPTASLSPRHAFLCLLCAAGFVRGTHCNGLGKKRKYQQL